MHPGFAARASSRVPPRRPPSAGRPRPRRCQLAPRDASMNGLEHWRGHPHRLRRRPPPAAVGRLRAGPRAGPRRLAAGPRRSHRSGPVRRYPRSAALGSAGSASFGCRRRAPCRGTPRPGGPGRALPLDGGFLGSSNTSRIPEGGAPSRPGAGAGAPGAAPRETPDGVLVGTRGRQGGSAPPLMRAAPRRSDTTSGDSIGESSAHVAAVVELPKPGEPEHVDPVREREGLLALDRRRPAGCSPWVEIGQGRETDDVATEVSQAKPSCE